MYTYPDYLMHFGVKGMKWGVRKAPRTQWGQRRAATRSHNIAIKSAWKNQQKNGVKGSAAYKSARSARRKNLLGRAVSRYSGYTRADEGRYYQNRQKGRGRVNSYLRTTARATLNNLAKGAAVYAIVRGAQYASRYYLNAKNNYGSFYNKRHGVKIINPNHLG